MVNFFFLIFLILFGFSNAQPPNVDKPVEFQNWSQFIKKSNNSNEFKENPQNYSGKQSTKIWLSLEPLRILSVDLDEQV